MQRITSVVSLPYASRYNVLPVEVTPQEITFATAEPFVHEWEREISQVQKRKIKRVFTNPEDIARYLMEFYSISRSVLGAERQNEGSPGTGAGIQNLEQLVELGRGGKLDANDQHVVSIVEWLLQYAFDQRASDIHIEPRREQGIIRFRIDGVLQQVYQLPAAVLAPVTSRIKILARMDIAEKRRPQDGRLKTRSPQGQEVELRLSTMPTAFGEKLVMRIFDPMVLLKDFRALGFTETDEKLWSGMIENPHGIILVTGPTGSGKTTTLYSTLKQVAKPEVNVCTVEDPIELVEPAFNQMQVQHNIDLTFAAGVRALMRQDPDIIMVGEIRDAETAEMAVQAALTGHLVLSTLHTNDAPASVSRLLDLNIPPYLLQSTLIGVIAQRLVRTLCPHCKKEGEISDEEWNTLVAPWKAQKPRKIQEAVGCLECRNTGYRGRVGIYEMLTFTPKLKPLIGTSFDMEALREAAIRDGMKPLRPARRAEGGGRRHHGGRGDARGTASGGPVLERGSGHAPRTHGSGLVPGAGGGAVRGAADTHRALHHAAGAQGRGPGGGAQGRHGLRRQPCRHYPSAGFHDPHRGSDVRGLRDTQGCLARHPPLRPSQKRRERRQDDARGGEKPECA